MKTNSLIAILLIGALQAQSPPDAQAQRYAAGALVEYSTPVGAKEVSSARLWPYKAKWTWRQLDSDPESETNGQLIDNGLLEEEFTHSENGDWLHRQVHYEPDGRIMTQNRRLDGATLQPLSISVKASPPRDGIESLTAVYRQHAYRGELLRSDGGADDFVGIVDVPAFSGWIGGVVIRALPLELGYRASLPATVEHTNTNYKLWIEVVGEEIVSAPDGTDIPVWNVEAGWIDLNSNDIYRQGPDYRGGLYQIAKSEMAGAPLVLNYTSSQTQILWTD